jgi:hypothetical protein
MKTSSRSSDSIQSGQPDAPEPREEGSVMFSLNALMSQAKTTANKPSPTATKDDSGLIDLEKLLAGSQEAPRAELIATHLDVFPLGRPPSPSTDAVEVSVPVDGQTPVRRAKAVWIAGAGVLAVALAGFAWNTLNPPVQSAHAQKGVMAAAAGRAPVIPPAPEPPVLVKPELPPAEVITKRPVVIRPRDPVKTTPVVTPPVNTTPCDLRCQMERAVKQAGKPMP